METPMRCDGRSFPSAMLAAAALYCCVAGANAWALGETRFVGFEPQPGAFALARPGNVAAILVDSSDYPGVTRVARDLQADIEKVTGARPSLENVPPPHAAAVVLIGTVGHSVLINALVTQGKLDLHEITGRWESWVRQVVPRPWPGVDEALVIAGSDKRGAIFGTYEVSEQIGVSPWYWWADVTPDHRDALYVSAERFVQGPPSVKYRGIFLNDEAPDLTNWIRAKFGNAPVRSEPPVPRGVANFGHEFYTRLFEVLLRLRANYLWPAMWSNAFNEDDPENARLADEYGIVMGTSHQEPMLRAQKEWDRRYLAGVGTWNYAKEPMLLEDFWRDGVRRNRSFESIITLGLRGANDTEMAPGGPAANRTLLEKIVTRQREILRKEVNPDLAKVSQLWCLYKEVQDYYESGMRVPDDVTLLWAEDNWGNVRRLPTPEERKRSGGAGVYYHFDYHGGPRSYQWVNTNPLPKIWEQLSLAKQYGADRIWIVNVGHFKGYEVPTEFFLNLAWDTSRWNGTNVNDFLRAWAGREFGPAHAAEIATIVADYAKYNGRRKPELLAPNTYNPVDHEAETVVADFRAIADAAQVLYNDMPSSKKDAFYQLVLFPTKASALVNELYLAAGQNQLYARQGRASANAKAAETRRLFEEDLKLMAFFNHNFANGRWAHFTDQTHLGYTTWQDPPRNSLHAIKLAAVTPAQAAALGVAVEGSETTGPESELTLPRFDSVNQQRRSIDIFNRGTTASTFTATCSAPWIRLSETTGAIGPDQRLWVTIDSTAVPSRDAHGEVRITGAGATAVIHVEARLPENLTRDTLRGFVENAGVVSIEPEHFTGIIRGTAGTWSRIADYGRTLSGMRSEGPIDTPAATPGGDSPALEYRMYVFQPGPANVVLITSPTLNFVPDRGLSVAVSFDDEKPTVVTLVPAGYHAQNGNADWERTVRDNARIVTSRHVLGSAGYHTLKIWMVDAGVVLQKVLVDLGGLQRTYLGPPESLWKNN